MIKKLSESDINKIAAGEVVKKPYNGMINFIKYIIIICLN